MTLSLTHYPTYYCIVRFPNCLKVGSGTLLIIERHHCCTFSSSSLSTPRKNFPHWEKNFPHWEKKLSTLFTFLGKCSSLSRHSFPCPVTHISDEQTFLLTFLRSSFKSCFMTRISDQRKHFFCKLFLLKRLREINKNISHLLKPITVQVILFPLLRMICFPQQTLVPPISHILINNLKSKVRANLSPR